jgi:tetratricopeptide (TPR) repeat protein
MVEALLGDAGLPEALKAKIVEAAAGNPLFVEQLTSMLIDTGRITRRDGHWRAVGDLSDLAIPPTVEALLAARVDDLSPDERAVLEPASVIGREFARDGVEAIAAAPVRPDVDLHLEGLAARQLVAPVPDEWPFDHRFHHSMIRDVAYDGLLKRARAELHESFVAWAEDAGLAHERALEFEELLGFHLEQAHRYRSELGPLDDYGVELGRRASGLLGAAGRRSLTRGDMPTAASLLRRAATTLPERDPEAPRLLVQVGEAEMEMGSFTEADATLASASILAAESDEGRLAAIAQLERVRLAYLTGSASDEREVVAAADRALTLFAGANDHEGLARAWRLSAYVELTRCQWGAAERAAEQMIENARAAGDTLMATRVLPALAVFILCGPTEAREGIARCEEILADVDGDRRASALTERARAHLLAMRGDFARAREAYRRARSDLEELGWNFDAALVSLDSGPIEMLAGDLPAAEAELRRDYEALEEMGESNYRSTTAAILAEALYRQDRLDEAAEFATISRDIAADDDVSSQVVWRCVAGKVLARGGRTTEGVANCRQALTLIEDTDDVSTHADTRVDLAEILTIAGRVPEAREELGRAFRLYEEKGNAVAAARTAQLTSALTGG